MTLFFPKDYINKFGCKTHLAAKKLTILDRFYGRLLLIISKNINLFWWFYRRNWYCNGRECGS